MTAVTRTLQPRPVIVVAGLAAALAVIVPLVAILGGRSTFLAAAVAFAAGVATLTLADRADDRLLGDGADAIRLAGASGALLAVPVALMALPFGAGVSIDRVAGPDRVATAIAVSQEAFPRAGAAVVVRPTAGADSVVAARLAADVGGPLLLAGDGVAEEVERLGARRVYSVGSAVRLDDVAVPVVQFEGEDGYRTAAAVALSVRPERAYVTSSWDDALAVPVRAGEAVLLTPADRLLPATTNALRQAQPAEVVVLDADPNVVAYLRALLPDADVRRGSGAGPTGGDAAWPWVAAEGSWADAVIAGVAAGATDRPLVLVDADGGSPSDDGTRWLRRNRREISEITVVGGLVPDRLLEDAAGT